MKKLLFTLLGTTTLLFSQAQAPNDNIGSGNCLDFDGVDDHAIMTGFDIDIYPKLTMELWFFLRGTPNSSFQHLIGNDNGDLDRALTILSGTIHVFAGNAFYDTNFVVDANTWYHIAVAYSESDIVLYINGIDVWNIGVPAAAFNGGDLYIGGAEWNGGSHYFNGQLDEIRVWDDVRTEVEVRNHMCATLNGNEQGLVGYWNMNEGTGNTVNDLTSNNNHGTRQ